MRKILILFFCHCHFSSIFAQFPYYPSVQKAPALPNAAPLPGLYYAQNGDNRTLDSLFPGLNVFRGDQMERCYTLNCLGAHKGFQIGGPQLRTPQYSSAPPLPRAPPLPKTQPLPRAPPLPKAAPIPRPPPLPDVPPLIVILLPLAPQLPPPPPLPLPRPLPHPRPLPLLSPPPLPRAQPLPRAPPLPRATFKPLTPSQPNPPLKLNVTDPITEIQKHLNAHRPQFVSYLNVPDAVNDTLGTLIPKLYEQGDDQVSNCYNPTLGGKQSNLDISENKFFDVVSAYYKEFPENFDSSRIPEKTANLFKTTQDIVKHCQGGPKSFQLGLNQLSDWSASEFAELMGAKPLDSSSVSKYQNRKIKKRKINVENFEEVGNNRQKREDPTVPAEPFCFPKDTTPIPAIYDWKDQGLVTDVRYQGHCGSCWTFATLASLESAYRIKGKSADLKFDLSEQQLMTCAKDNGKGDGCNGGTSIDAFNFILTNFGVTDEKTIGYDYEKKGKTCETKKKKRVAKIKDYCLRGTYVTVDGKPEILSDKDIQSVIREFGSVYATVFGEQSNLQHYSKGVFDDPKCSKKTNHAITIVGWDESAWIVKNSWGTKWGEDGFFRIKRGENMCGINTYITFPIV